MSSPQPAESLPLDPERPLLHIVGERASERYQDGVLQVFDDPDLLPDAEPLLVLRVRPGDLGLAE